MKMKRWIHHRFNPLHVYCRLIDAGFSKTASRKIARVYEIWVYMYFASEKGTLVI